MENAAGQGHWSVSRSNAFYRHTTSALSVVVVGIPIVFAFDFEFVRALEIAPEQALPTVLGAAFFIIFTRFAPAGKGVFARAPFSIALFWLDIMLALIGVGACAYFTVIYNDLINEYFYNRDKAFLIGVVIIPLIVEALRRTAGWSLVIVLLSFFAYAFVGHLIPGDLQSHEKKLLPLIAYLTADHVALFGLPMRIVTYVVVLFILMGQLLLRTGASHWFTDLSAALLGRSRGGSAKIAVVASGLFGSISGSAVSNVASTGVITIPLMRQGGYNRTTAGALEAVASTGGQIMPPIMGAAAFLMAEFLEVEYTAVILAALIPALLYYFSAFVQADLEAARLDIAPLDPDQIPSKWRVLKSGWYFTLPFIILIFALFSLNKPASEAALWAAISLPIVSFAFGSGDGRLSLAEFVRGLAQGGNLSDMSGALLRTVRKAVVDIGKSLIEAGRASVQIVIIGAMAGLIIGIIETTGLGSALTIVLLNIGEDSLILLLVLTAAISIVLGMGMPTTAIYVLLAIMVTPPLIKLGIDPMAAHLFVLYYGLMSMITPPVAIAAFTAANIAGATPMATAVTACRLGWVAYVVPFLFVFEPALIMDGDVSEILVSLAAVTAGVWIVSAGLLGYLFTALRAPMRLAFIIAGGLLLLPAGIVDYGSVIRVAGAALAVLLVGREVVAKRGQQTTSREVD